MHTAPPVLQTSGPSHLISQEPPFRRGEKQEKGSDGAAGGRSANSRAEALACRGQWAVGRPGELPCLQDSPGASQAKTEFVGT